MHNGALHPFKTEVFQNAMYCSYHSLADTSFYCNLNAKDHELLLFGITLRSFMWSILHLCIDFRQSINLLSLFLLHQNEYNIPGYEYD